MKMTDFRIETFLLKLTQMEACITWEEVEKKLQVLKKMEAEKELSVVQYRMMIKRMFMPLLVRTTY